MTAFVPILILLGAAVLLCVGILVGSYALGPKSPQRSKLLPYECGVLPEGSPHAPFASRFYLVAVMFLLVDVEAAFFFPWSLVYREILPLGAMHLVALVVYMGFFGVGLYFIVKKDCLRLR